MSFLARDPEMQRLLGLDGRVTAMVGGAYEASSRFDRELAT
ncbi:hypothetical protein [Azospirillum doebereinerae]|nr:hypothetical protein [Azospirillum doebereinerae]